MNSSVTIKSYEPQVDILLATFNGECFLGEQIESILGQEYANYKLIVRDDGSSDGTMAIIRNYIERFPGKISLLDDSMGNVGSSGNFLRLIASSTADYVMLSDQDDVWLPGKVSMTMRAMRENEEKHGRLMPILVHTDLKVANGELSVIADSFWKYQKLSPHCDGINRLLVQNVVTGCTVMINRKLVDLVRPDSTGMIEHDWWLALIAASFGKIAFVPEASMLYRQHGKNAVGAVKWSPVSMLRKFFVDENKNVIIANLAKSRIQAAHFLKEYEQLLPPEIGGKIAKYSKLHELRFLPKLVCVIRYRFFKIGVMRNIGMMLRIRSIS